MNINPRHIILLFGLATIAPYNAVNCQVKDSTSIFIIRKNVPCEATLAGKAASGKETNYTLIISADEILKDPYVRTNGCEGYTVTSFEMVLTVNGATVKKSCDGNHLTPEMIGIIRRISKGSHIIFQNVHYKLSNGEKGVMPGINVLIS